MPNGLAFSPDGKTMYLSDSHPSRAMVWAFDYDVDSGTPHNRRPFIPALPAGRPDGAAVDADGGYWICGNDAGRVYRYTPDGRLDQTYVAWGAAMPPRSGANRRWRFPPGPARRDAGRTTRRPRRRGRHRQGVST